MQTLALRSKNANFVHWKISKMALVDLIMPKMGESIMEATILSWLKKPGDKIEQDESVLEVATDKVDTEVPSTHAGVLKEILAKDGEVVKVGTAIAVIATDGDDNKSTDTPATQTKSKSSGPTPEPVIAEAKSNGAGQVAVADFKSSDRFYSPLVKNIAKEENIPVAELETVPGTGSEGRVTKKDILAYVQTRLHSCPISTGLTSKP